ncbi:MAG: NAD(P)H-dependent oxidoreductase [Clostridiales bacterium]
MEKILFINACVRPESRTRFLAAEVLNQMDGVVEEINLEKAGIEPLNFQSLQERNTGIQNNDFTSPVFQYAKQFSDADKIVIAAPYWDLSFPSALRVYFEAVTIHGLSFNYSSEGIPTGLCKGKKLIYVTTSGGSIADLNLGFDYIKALAQTFYGIPEVLCFKVENLDIFGADVEKSLEKGIEEIRNSKDLINK